VVNLASALQGAEKSRKDTATVRSEYLHRYRAAVWTNTIDSTGLGHRDRHCSHRNSSSIKVAHPGRKCEDMKELAVGQFIAVGSAIGVRVNK
jgi:hypothetical protein